MRLSCPMLVILTIILNLKVKLVGNLYHVETRPSGMIVYGLDDSSQIECHLWPNDFTVPLSDEEINHKH